METTRPCCAVSSALKLAGPSPQPTMRRRRYRDGFRIGAGGDTLLVTLEWPHTLSTPPTAFELIKEYWEKV